MRIPKHLALKANGAWIHETQTIANKETVLKDLQGLTVILPPGFSVEGAKRKKHISGLP